MDTSFIKLWMWMLAVFLLISESVAAPHNPTDLNHLVMRLDKLQQQIDDLQEIIKEQNTKILRCTDSCQGGSVPRKSVPSEKVDIVPRYAPVEIEPRPYVLKPKPVSFDEQNESQDPVELNQDENILTLQRPTPGTRGRRHLLKIMHIWSSGSPANSDGTKSVSATPKKESYSDSGDDYYEATCEMKSDDGEEYSISGTLKITQKMTGNGVIRIRGKISGMQNVTELHSIMIHESDEANGTCSNIGETMTGEMFGEEYFRGNIHSFIARNGTAAIDFRTPLYDLVGDHSILGKSIVIHPYKMACCTVKPTKNIPTGRISLTGIRFNG